MTTREFLFSAWKWNPVAIAGCAVIVGLFVYALRGRRKISGKQIALLMLALAIFALTLVSPLDALADGYLFSAHMLQHLLLLLVVPPLLLMAMSTHAGTNSKKLRGLKVFGCWLAGVGAMWFWHEPTLCDAATSNAGIRGLQTISLLILGAAFWQPIIAPNASRRIAPLAGVLYLFTACVGCTLLGIIITFTPVSVCPIYMHPMDAQGLLPLIREGWGITPSVDQQIGGLLMWVPACLIYLCGIVGLLARWYAAAEIQPDSPAEEIAPNLKPKSSHA